MSDSKRIVRFVGPFQPGCRAAISVAVIGSSRYPGQVLCVGKSKCPLSPESKGVTVGSLEVELNLGNSRSVFIFLLGWHACRTCIPRAPSIGKFKHLIVDNQMRIVGQTWQTPCTGTPQTQSRTSFKLPVDMAIGVHQHPWHFHFLM